jgi:hypothetical protein
VEGDVIAMDMVEQRQYSGHAKVEGWRAGGTGSRKGEGRRGCAKVEGWRGGAPSRRGWAARRREGGGGGEAMRRWRLDEWITGHEQ